MINRMSAKQVFAASLMQLLEGRSIRNVSVTMICQNCGLSSRTFYNHFRDKDDLVFWIYRSFLDVLLERIDDDYSWKDAVIETLTYFKEHRSFYRNAMLNTEGYNSFISIATRYIYESACRVIQKRTDSWPLTKATEFQLQLYFYGAASMSYDWGKNWMDVDPETFGNWLVLSMPDDIKKLLIDSEEK